MIRVTECIFALGDSHDPTEDRERISWHGYTLSSQDDVIEHSVPSWWHYLRRL